MKAFTRQSAVLAVGVWLAAVGAVRAAAPPDAGPVLLAFVGPDAPLPPGAAFVDVIPASCASCSQGLFGGLFPSPAGSGVGTLGPPPVPPLPGPQREPDCPCNGAGCVPGRRPCYPCEAKSALGRFFCGLYECVCCPDPCYEGRWIPLADAAFFVDAVRPVTQQKIRWDSGHRVALLDRAEFFWARADGRGKGPRLGGLTGRTPSGPPFTHPGLRYNDFILITEGGTGLVSLVVETPYRNLQSDLGLHSAGFADMSLATKTLLFDCELLQIAFQFKTYLPTGNFTKGVGVGHISLEPSLLLGLKLTPTCYFQMQVAEWIPLGGDPGYSGSMLHFHGSINKEVCRVLPDVPVIATAELNGWSFQDGLYTDPLLGPGQKASGYTYLSAGGGLRLFVCDRIDFGFGAAFALTEQHFARELYRTEFRLRY